LEDGTKFCYHCGTEIKTKNCPGCGRQVDAESAFCQFCGKPLIKKEPIAPAPIPASTPVPVQEATPAPGPVPASGPIPASGSVPASGPVLASGPIPAPGSVPASGPIPAPPPMQPQALMPSPAPMPVQGSVPAPTPVPMPNPIPAPTPVPMPNPIPAPMTVPMPNTVPVPMQVSMPIPAPMPAAPVNQTGTIKKPGKVLPKILIAAAIVAVIVIAAILIPRLLTGNKSVDAALYLKDGEINYTSLSSVKPREITDQLDEYGDLAGGYVGYLSYVITLSNGGKRIFYPDKMTDSDVGMTIYYRDLKSKNSEGIKVDSEISLFKTNSAGSKIYYIKGADRNLYVNDLKDKEKLDTDVDMFYINADGSRLIYINADGNIYEKDGKKNKEKIDSNCSIISVSEKLDTIYYQKGNSLYLKKTGKDKEKILSDVSSVIHVYDSGEIYYLKTEEINHNLSDFVEDDLKAADDALVEPAQPIYPNYDNYKPDMEYPIEPDYYSYTDYWGYIDWDAYDAAYNEYYDKVDEYNAKWDAGYDAALEEYNKAYDEYLTAYDTYFAKLDRDSIRASIEGVKIPVTNYTLYYYDTKEAKAVTDRYASYLDYSLEKPVLIYENYNETGITKVNISEVVSYDDLYMRATDSLDAATEVYTAINSAAAEVKHSGSTSYYLSHSGNAVYYLDDYDAANSSGDLYEIKITGDKLGSPSKIEDDVYSLQLLYNSDSLLYFKEVKDSSGDMYLDNKLVDSDVYIYTAYEAADTDSILYYVDYNTDKATGTLKLYQGKTSVKIGDDIHSYYAIGEKRVIYLADYNTNRGKGDLYLYNGSDKKKKIDTDVTGIIPIYDNDYRGEYSYLWQY
jgi:hypothetical protein